LQQVRQLRLVSHPIETAAAALTTTTTTTTIIIIITLFHAFLM